MSRAKIVLTGATGFLGRHFLHELLARDPEARVVAIVRAESVVHARKRVLDAVTRAARSRGATVRPDAAERVEVVVGDILAPSCGLGLEDVGRLREGGVEVLWHLAATTDFDSANAAMITRINVDGTGHAITLAAQIGARRFVHTSTSYCCGGIAGDVAEALHSPLSPFTNAYERSKCLSEHLVAATCAAAGIDWRIVRPSIVVGPIATHAADGAKHGMYGFLRGVYAMREALGQIGAPLRLAGDPTVPLNVVPVDHAVRTMVSLGESGFPGAPIHHLTSDACPTIEEALGAVCDASGVARFALTPGSIDGPTPFEAALEEGTRHYAGYLHRAKRFTRAFGAPSEVSGDDVRQFCARWVEERRARATAAHAEPPRGAAHVDA